MSDKICNNLIANNENSEDEELEYEELIEKYHLEVVNNLDMNRQFIFSYLRSKNVIDEEDCEIVINTAKTRKQKVSVFLDIIKRKGTCGIKHFIDALEFEHPQLYRMFTGKEAAPVLVPPSQDLFTKAGLPGKEYIDLDRELLAEQLEQTVKILHQKARIINRLQDEKNVLEKKLFEANESTRSLQQYVELIKSELDRSSEIREEAITSFENNNDTLLHSMQNLQQEVMTRMTMVIALQGKLLAQTEQMEAMKTEILELKAKSNSWKQEVYELTLQCDNERRQSRRLNEQVQNQSCDPEDKDTVRKESLQLRMEIGRLKEENETLREDLAEFRKYSEVLNAKFSILSREKNELQEQNDELIQIQKTLSDQFDEMKGKTKWMQRDHHYLKKSNDRYLSDIKQYREIQQTLYADLEALKNEAISLRKRNDEQEASIHKQYNINMVLEEKYKSATNEIDELREELLEANKELRSHERSTSMISSNSDDGTLTFPSFQGNFPDIDDVSDDETGDNSATLRFRSNKELLDSIRKKVISPCQSPTVPNRQKSHTVPLQNNFPKVKGLLTYEQLGLLFPPDVTAAYLATYQLQNSEESNQQILSEEICIEEGGKHKSENESITSGPLSAKVLQNGLQPFIFDKSDLFQQSNYISSETTLRSVSLNSGEEKDKKFRRRTKQVDSEHLSALNRRRSSTANILSRT